MDNSNKELFSSPFLAVRAHDDAAINDAATYIRTDESKQRLLVLARLALSRLFEDENTGASDISSSVSEAWNPIADVDVTLWVDGACRGSRVVCGRTLVSGVVAAVVSAARDPRFKPLTKEELPRARIEIAIFSSLRVRLTQSEFASDVIYPEKGYVFSDRGKEGWYLPIIHNIRRFDSLRDFSASLARDKAGADALRRVSSVALFDIVDFVESASHDRVISLAGPTPCLASRDNTDAWYFAAADSLCENQQDDGTIPAITDVFSGRTRGESDWLRLGLAGHTLAEFGLRVGGKGKRYIEAARRIFAYFERNYFMAHCSSIADYALMLSYVVKLARSLGSEDVASMLLQRLMKDREQKKFPWDGILAMAHIAGVLRASRQLEHQEEAERIMGKLVESLKQENFATFRPVVWAESVALLWENDRRMAHEIADRILKVPMPEGRPTDSPLSYSRGAAKVLEVLVLDSGRYRKEIKSLENWLRTMQYNEESMYFVPNHIHAKIAGGFRHDWTNPEMWSDAAAHCILAGARLYESRD